MSKVSKIGLAGLMGVSALTAGIVVPAGVSAAEPNPAEDFMYSESNGEITITGIQSSAQVNGSVLHIPEEIDGKPVVSIYITGGKRITYSNIIIPKTLTGKVGLYANESGKIEVDAGNPKYKDINGDGVYTIDGKELVRGTTANKVEYGTEKVGDNAFENVGVTELNLPETVKEIGDSAYQLTNIKNLTIPGHVETVGRGAFRNGEVENLEIEEGVKEVGREAFGYNKIKTLKISKTVRISTSFGEGHQFRGNQPIEIIEVHPDSPYYEVEDGVMYRKDGTDALIGTVGGILREGTKIVGGYAFEGRGGTDLYLPESVTGIGDDAYANSRLTEVKLHEGVTGIGSRAFKNNNIKEVKLPESLIGINSGTFDDNKIEELNLPSSLINLNGFKNNNIKEVTVPEGVTQISSDAFRGNPLTKIIILGKDVNYIGNNAFTPKSPLSKESVTIYGYMGSVAETYAGNNDHKFIPLDTVEDNGGSVESQEVTVNFDSGDLTLEVPDEVDFGTHELDGNTLIVEREFTGDLQVTDARGTGEGWSLSVSASPLTMVTDIGGEEYRLKHGTLLISSTEVIHHNGKEDNLPIIEHISEGIVDDGSEVLLSIAEEGTGKGITKFGFKDYGLKLVADPVDIKVNSNKGKNGKVAATRYETTLNWNLVSGL